MAEDGPANFEAEAIGRTHSGESWVLAGLAIQANHHNL
jgi:hypothetical protein